jgi:hypothetical protein
MAAGLPKANTSHSCHVSGCGDSNDSHQRLSRRDVSSLLCANKLCLSGSHAVHTPDQDILTEDETTHAAAMFRQSVGESDPMPAANGSPSTDGLHQTD